MDAGRVFREGVRSSEVVARGGGTAVARGEPTALNFQENRNDADVLTRVRVKTLVTPRAWLRFFGEWQDARAFGYNPPVPGGFTNRMDLRQAYAEDGTAEASGWGLRVGRQALKYDKGRLVWDPDWGKCGRVFDAVRLTGACVVAPGPQIRSFQHPEYTFGIYG